MRNNKTKWYAGIVKNKNTNESELLVLIPQVSGGGSSFDSNMLSSIKTPSDLKFRKLDKEKEIDGVKLDIYSAKLTKDVKDVPLMLVDTSKAIGVKDGIMYENNMLYIYASIINDILSSK